MNLLQRSQSRAGAQQPRLRGTGVFSARAQLPRSLGARWLAQPHSHGLPRTHRPHPLRVATEQEVTTAAPVKQTEEEQQQDEGKTYKWFKQWYPMIPIESLDAARPVNIPLLGLELVVWGDGQGNWNCMEDRCSHRLAPLSEGRITPDGKLACSYHGWTFDGKGKLQNIPQIANDPAAAPGTLAQACDNACSSVKAYPTKVEHGVLWVWPSCGLEAIAESAATPGSMGLEAAEGFSSGDWAEMSTWYFRDVPLRFDTLLENVVDPSHVPFSHHGIQGNRDNVPKTTYRAGSAVSLNGFTMTIERTQADASVVASPMRFTAPGLVCYNGPTVCAYFQATPTRPGWSRIAAMFLYNTKDTKAAGKLKVIAFLSKKLAALDHALNRNEIIDGDTYFLHVSERELLKGGNRWQHDYYMPAASDVGVVQIRRWLDKFGGTVPTLVKTMAEMPLQMPREQVLDRHHQHVKSCKHCQDGIKQIEIIRVVGYGIAATAAVLLMAMGVAGKPLATWGSLGLLVAAALGVLLATKLSWLRTKFFYTDYVHALR